MQCSLGLPSTRTSPLFCERGWRAGKRLLCLLLMLSLGCSGSGKKAKHVSARDPDAVRYRLLLRHNPVDPGDAFRCFGGCQSHVTPSGYIQCLQGCPGFEITTGMRCDEFETPPIAACMTAFKVKQKDDMDPGLLVLSVIAGVAVVVALSSVCSASLGGPQCGYGYAFPSPSGL